MFVWEGAGLRCNNWKVQHTFTHAAWHMDCWQINRRRRSSLHKWRYKTARILLIEALSDRTRDVAPLSLCPADMPQESPLFVLMLYDACCRYHIFQGNTNSTIHMSGSPLWRLTNARCQKLLVVFIIVRLAPLGTAKSLTCAMFLSERLTVWMCDPASTGDSWSPLCALYPCELHSPKDVLTWSGDPAMTLRGCLDCPNSNMFKKRKNLWWYLWPQRCCQLSGVTLYRYVFPWKHWERVSKWSEITESSLE